MSQLRFRLRTLLIVLALGPAVLAVVGPAIMTAYGEWRWPARKSEIGGGGFQAIESIRAPANHPNAPRR